MATKWVYLFSEGNRDMRNLLGGKGAGLAEMTNAGLPVPPASPSPPKPATPTRLPGRSSPKACGPGPGSAGCGREADRQEVRRPQEPAAGLRALRRQVRMPGMMDTVLNLGLNEETLKGLVALTGNERFAYDAYRRFIQMFGRIVMGIEGRTFEQILDECKEKTAGGKDTDLTADMLKEIVDEFKAVYKQETEQRLPHRSRSSSCKFAIGAVFGSWMGQRAVDYRSIHKIPHDLGTAVNVQTMVFGNMGERLGHRRRLHPQPVHRREGSYGEYLQNAQGEDVVAGIRTPKKIAQLEEDMPGDLQAVRADCRPAREPLPRDAGHGVHHRARQALHAADPHRQAHGGCRGQDRRGHGGRGADHQETRP